MRVIVIGNGVLALSGAREILKRDSSIEVVILGPRDRKGCASLAAAAMFNSFAEVDEYTFTNEAETLKFELNRMSAPLWEGHLDELREESNETIDADFGTFVINNHVSDSLEDRTFDAIVNALEVKGEAFDHISPRDITNYKPTPSARASRGVYIPNEGFVNPNHLINGLERSLEKLGNVEMIDCEVDHLKFKAGKIISVADTSGQIYEGDSFLLAPGANFSSIIKKSDLPVEFPRIFYGVGCGVLLKTGENTLGKCIRTPNRGLACGVYCTPREKQYSFVGASNLIAPEPYPNARLTSVHSLLEAAMDQINSDFYRADFITVKVGWRPTSEDTLPLLGRAMDNLTIATGTKRDGLHSSPVIGKGLAELVLGAGEVSAFKGFEPVRSPQRVVKRKDAIDAAVSHKLNAVFQHGFKPSRDRMVEGLEAQYRKDITELHDKVGAVSWGIPPEMIDMYRYGHAC